MKISGTIRDNTAMFTLPSSALKVETGAYVFPMRGLPMAWSEATLTRLLKAWGRKHGFTALTVSATSTTISKWNARIQFYYPERVKSNTERSKPKKA